MVPPNTTNNIIIINMNSQLSLLETIQTGFLSASKSKHATIKRGVDILNGTAYDETVNPPQQISVSMDRVKELTQYVIYILETMNIPEQVQELVKNETESTLFLMLYQLYSEAIRLRIADKIFSETLHSWKIAQAKNKVLTQIYNDNFTTLTEKSRAQCISQPTLESFEWRIDVIISTTQLNKAFIPIILFQITTSQGDIRTFECDVATFHKLRYSVAKMCAIMQEIDTHPTLQRLVD